MNRRVLLLIIAAITLLPLSIAGSIEVGIADAHNRSLSAPGDTYNTVVGSNASPFSPVGYTFQYQGQLNQGGVPANGQYDFICALYDALAGGNQVGSPVILINQNVNQGIFTLALDFGSAAFQGQERWLEMAVRQTGGGTYTPLAPRQVVGAAPYAMSLMPRAVITGTLGDPSLALLTANNNGAYGIGLQGESNNGPATTGVFGKSDNGRGIWGESSAGAGVYATGRTGIFVSGSDYAIYALAGNSYAGYFAGPVHVNGTLSKAAGSFKIDHPLDPENKYLYHSFVESPDMMNVYNDNVTLDGKGEAWVELPDWFETLNKDFRYQLTAIGAPGPNLYVAEKVKNNHFKIAGGTAGMEVSWQVTGIRQDPYANAHRIPVEGDKPKDERGKYLYPTEHGQPESAGVEYEHQQKVQHLGR